MNFIENIIRVETTFKTNTGEWPSFLKQLRASLYEVNRLGDGVGGESNCVGGEEAV